LENKRAEQVMPGNRRGGREEERWPEQYIHT
jgi:hypothetical protein